MISLTKLYSNQAVNGLLLPSVNDTITSLLAPLPFQLSAKSRSPSAVTFWKFLIISLFHSHSVVLILRIKYYNLENSWSGYTSMNISECNVLLIAFYSSYVTSDVCDIWKSIAEMRFVWNLKEQHPDRPLDLPTTTDRSTAHQSQEPSLPIWSVTRMLSLAATPAIASAAAASSSNVVISLSVSLHLHFSLRL